MILPIASHDIVMLHSSKGVRQDKYGCKDLLGVNDRMEREIEDYFREVLDMSQSVDISKSASGWVAPWQLLSFLRLPDMHNRCSQNPQAVRKLVA